ncbi:cupin domain-containing protein [Polaribacter sp. WD7]|uniref:cupin domain-containing protein n=1 Tax=Polaribacter sp. WD7 TaxID=2269061 RepID=UPI000DF1B382|nr:cupin domain-containing protein [Polaribacter sp. WD7]RCS26559.1 cupin domain-containing protein [Polaribacter sp. WD7]
MKTFGASKKFLFADDIEWETVGEGVKRKIMGYDDKIMLVVVAFEEGGIGNEHKHYHSQVTYVESGTFEFSIGGETKTVKGGDTVYIPPHVLHGAVCTKKGTLIDVFSPIREDFME